MLNFFILLSPSSTRFITTETILNPRVPNAMHFSIGQKNSIRINQKIVREVKRRDIYENLTFEFSIIFIRPKERLTVNLVPNFQKAEKTLIRIKHQVKSKITQQSPEHFERVTTCRKG